MIDELLRHTEPCASCTTGIEWLTCYDGIRRCRNCVHDHAQEMGWDTLSEPSPPPVVVDSGASAQAGTVEAITPAENPQTCLDLGAAD